MTRVLLINPFLRQYDLGGSAATFLPIGLLSIAANIRDGCEVKILDCLITEPETVRKSDHTLFGMPLEKVEQRVREFRPDIIGISIPFSHQAENAKIIASACKRIRPEAAVLFGGANVTVNYESLLRESKADFCVVGEGEETFREFVARISAGQDAETIAGLASRGREGIRFRARTPIENLDSLPFPAYDLVDMAAYLKDKNLYRDRGVVPKAVSMITSRGCPFRCVFCYAPLHMGRKYRAHSPEYVLKHIRFLKERYGVSNFLFEDDNMSLDRVRFEKILDGIIENGLDIRWDSPNGIRVDTLDAGLIKKIKKSGCGQLMVAIESGSQRVLDHVIKKGLMLDEAMKVLRAAREEGVFVRAFYSFGYPGETLKEMEETTGLAIRLLREYDVLPYVFVATPFPGTELYRIAMQNGFIKKEPSEKDLASCLLIYGQPLIGTEVFGVDDVKRLASDYLSRLKKEIILYGTRHPFFLFKILKGKLPILKRYIRWS
jgi:magnesium-protoporphyrin IX monomethyl ester (oxidative) cyclase